MKTILGLLLLLFGCSGDKVGVRPLSNIKSFATISLICSPMLTNKLIEEGFDRSLEKLGSVSLSSNGERAPSLTLWMGNISEGNTFKKYRYLPVIWVSLQVVDSVQILGNRSSGMGIVWRKDVYFEEEDTIEQTTAKGIEYVQDLVKQFGIEYAESNHDTSPRFFVHTT